jgi:hypothetical protein
VYSGTTLTNISGHFLGAHQKIDRIAYKHFKTVSGDVFFPKINEILHFEGKNGPDGIKRKSPAKDEPWHFHDPLSDDRSPIFTDIKKHYTNLVNELRSQSHEKAAFEAAWLAHAIVDGLTPAHHYPYEKKLEKLRGSTSETRDSIKEKLFIPGTNIGERLRKNWEVWGVGGLMTMHGVFELGVAAIIKPLKLPNAKPSTDDIAEFAKIGVEEYFKRAAKQIASLEMYDRFLKFGWRSKLVRDIKNELAPTITKTVSIAWIMAAKEAEQGRKKD